MRPGLQKGQNKARLADVFPGRGLARYEEEGTFSVMRRVVGAVGGAGISLVVALACVGSAEKTADGAGATTADGGVLSSFVARAQRGEVGPPDLDDVEHMCALLMSCDRLPIPPGNIPPDFQGCVKHFTEEMTSASAVTFPLTLRECGLQANSCASLRTCALHGADAGSCNGRGKSGAAGFCDVDGRAITCFHEQMVAVRDCTRGGEQCVIAGGEAKCTLGPCPGTIKDGDKPQCSASGTHRLTCDKGKLLSTDCAVFGLKCTTGADGAAACATASPACTTGAKRCDGTTAVGCFNGHEVRIDCAAAGLTCVPGTGSSPVGACSQPAPPAGACDPNDKPRCDGASVKYCFNGKPRSYFCKALGFNRCDPKTVRCAL